MSLLLHTQSHGEKKAFRPFHFDDLRVDALSTWTPAGLCASIRYSLCNGPEAEILKHSPPNEIAIFSNVTIKSVAVQMSEELIKLLPRRKSPKVSSGSAQPNDVHTSSIEMPKVNVSLEVQSITARYDVSSEERQEAFILSIPNTQLTLQTDFQEHHIRRSDAARRAAWKGYDKDTLAWRRSVQVTRPNLFSTSSESAITRAEPEDDNNFAEALEHDGRRSSAASDGRAHSSSRSAYRTSQSAQQDHPTHLHKASLQATLSSIQVTLSGAKAVGPRKLVHVGQIECKSNAALDAWSSDSGQAAIVAFKSKRLQNQVLIEGVDIDLCGAEIWESLQRAAARSVPQDSGPRPERSSSTILDRLPSNLLSHLCVREIDVKLATVDPKRDPSSLAGVRLRVRALASDYANQIGTSSTTYQGMNWAARGALELEEDAAFSAGALAAKHGRAAVLKTWVDQFSILPIDPAASPSPKSNGAEKSLQHAIVTMPSSKVKLCVHPEPRSPDDSEAPRSRLTFSFEHTEPITLGIELAHTYLLLLAGSCILRLLPHRARERPHRDDTQSANQSGLLKMVDVEIQRVDMRIALPEGVKLFLGVRRLHLHHSPSVLGSIAMESVVGAARLPTQSPSDERFSEVLSLRDWKIQLHKSKGEELPSVQVHADSAVFNVPFSFQVHDIIEGTSVAVKATKQLLHDTLLQRDGIAINAKKMSPLRLPNITLQMRMLVLEAEDDPLETRLGLIYKVGKEESRSRLERDAAFAQRVSNKASRESHVSLDREDVEPGSDSASLRNAGLPILRLAEDARRRLDAFNASAWVRRVAKARASQEAREDRFGKQILGRFPKSFKGHSWPVAVKSRRAVAPLFRSTMSSVHLKIGQPHFGTENARDFINRHGDPIPAGLEFSIFVPMHIEWKMSEWRINLRDYPLPLLHIPLSSSGEAPSWEISTDICIAEQLGGTESTRHVPACIIHNICPADCDAAYVIQVPKVALPTKFFGSPKINLHSGSPVRLTWGQSLQPTISDMVRVFDGFSSPPHDPSPKLGFWDKVRETGHFVSALD